MKILGQLELGYIMTLMPEKKVKSKIVLTQKQEAEANKEFLEHVGKQGLLIIGGPEERIGKRVRILSSSFIPLEVMALNDKGEHELITGVVWSEGDIVYTLAENESYN